MSDEEAQLLELMNLKQTMHELDLRYTALMADNLYLGNKILALLEMMAAPEPNNDKYTGAFLEAIDDVLANLADVELHLRHELFFPYTGSESLLQPEPKTLFSFPHLLDTQSESVINNLIKHFVQSYEKTYETYEGEVKKKPKMTMSREELHSLMRPAFRAMINHAQKKKRGEASPGS